MNRKPSSINFWFNDDYFRDVILKGFLCVIGTASAILIVLNLLVGQTILALLEMVLLAFTVSVWFMPRDWRVFKWTVLCYVAFLFGGIIASIALSSLFSGRQVWVLIFPVASYLMLGRRIAMCLSAICLGLVSAIMMVRFEGEYQSYMRGILVNLLLSYAFIWGLSHGAALVIKRILAALRQIASTDPLTGLSNRRNIDVKFKLALHSKINSTGGLGFVLMDLDHFKDVNDTYGHDVGDALLVDFAERLRSFNEADPEYSLYRLGGEEFCVWLPGHLSQSWSEAFCQYVHDTPFMFQGHTIHYTVSIGLVTSDQTTETFQRLYSLADKWLYQAKKSGRNRVVVETL